MGEPAPSADAGDDPADRAPATTDGPQPLVPFSGALALTGQVTRTPTGEVVKPVSAQLPVPPPPMSGPQNVVAAETDSTDSTDSTGRFFTPVQILILAIVIAALGILIGFAIAESRYAAATALPLSPQYSVVLTEPNQRIL